MKAKKIISFLLMLTILFTMNIAPVLAEDTETEKHTLELIFNNEGGNVVTGGDFYKDDLICGEDEHGEDEHNVDCFSKVLDCDFDEHTHDDDDCYEKENTCTHECDREECYTLECTHEHKTGKGGCYPLDCKHNCWSPHNDEFCIPHIYCTHKHNNSCYSNNPTNCTHEHGDDCYTEACEHECSDELGCFTDKLTCTKNEHTHDDDDCYKRVKNCHTHDEGCYDWPEADVVATPKPGYYIQSISIDEASENVLDPSGYSTSLKMDQDHAVSVVFAEKPARELTVSFNQGDSVPGAKNAWVIANPSTQEIDYEWVINGGSQTGTGTIAAGATIPIETDVEYNPDTIEINWTNSSDGTDYDYADAKMFVGITAEAQNGRFEDEGGRTLSSTPTYYFAGTTVILKAIPNSGYHFVNDTWIIAPEEVVQSINGDTATLIIPDFEPQYAVNEGTMITLAATGDLLLGYDDDDELKVPSVTVEGQFSRNSTPSRREKEDTMYTLDVDIEGPGSVSPTSGSYESGSNVKLTPTADEGAQFVGWFGKDGDDVSDSNRILMNGSKSVIARFEIIPVEEIIEEDIPEAGDIVQEEIVPDEYVPQAGETLPQTGGIPMELFVGLGFALIGGGVSLNKKEEKKDKK